MKVKVGVFWLCNFDIIYDTEEYELSDNSRVIIDYASEHKDVWEKLSAIQCGGKYANYRYDFFKRGRVGYDCENKSYLIELNGYTENLPQNTISEIKRLFHIEN